MKTFYSRSIIGLSAIALLISCGGEKKTDAHEAPQKQNVKVEEIKIEPVEQLQTFTATVEADQVNNISSGIPGRIRRILVDVGAQVRKGQALVEIDKTNFSQQQTQLENLRKDYQRYVELFQVGGISQQQIDQLKAQLDVAETSFRNLRENTTLSSPSNGVVTARNYDSGDMPSVQPILTVATINPVKARVSVSESFYNNVSKGMPVDVKIDVFGDETFKGKVSLIYPTLDPVSHTFPVEIEMQNSNLRIKPGMFARVTMNFGTNERPLIPDMAVLKQAGSNDRYVFTVKENKAVYTKVELGRRIEDKYEIVSGLQPGDRIIVQGNANLIDGEEIAEVR